MCRQEESRAEKAGAGSVDVCPVVCPVVPSIFWFILPQAKRRLEGQASLDSAVSENLQPATCMQKIMQRLSRTWGRGRLGWGHEHKAWLRGRLELPLAPMDLTLRTCAAMCLGSASLSISWSALRCSSGRKTGHGRRSCTSWRKLSPLSAPARVGLGDLKFSEP